MLSGQMFSPGTSSALISPGGSDGGRLPNSKDLAAAEWRVRLRDHFRYWAGDEFGVRARGVKPCRTWAHL